MEVGVFVIWVFGNNYIKYNSVIRGDWVFNFFKLIKSEKIDIGKGRWFRGKLGIIIKYFENLSF